MVRVSAFKTAEYEKLTEEQQRKADASKFEEILAEAVTDTDGVARLTVLKTGTFTLQPVSPADQLDWVYVDVSDNAPTSVIDVRWPSYAILRTSRIRGKLTKGLYSSESVPLSETALRLHTPADYREVGTTTTSSDGSFEFKNVARGLYLIEIVPNEKPTKDLYKPEGNIAVYVSPDANVDALEISTANTSCGLMYDLESNKSRYKPEACFKGGKAVQCD